jgi:hypothetical protein
MLLNRVRTSHYTLSFPFRCDAPHLRRFMHLDISPLPRSGIAFLSCVTREERREPVALLDANAPRNDTFVKICCFCKKVKLENQNWVEVETAIQELGLFNDKALPNLTHGICPTCHADYRHRILNKQ